MSNLLNHLPALQIFVPIFSGFIIILLRSNRLACFIFKFSAFLSFLVTIGMFYKVLQGFSLKYTFGGFDTYSGISFSLDNLNLPILLLCNFLLFTSSLMLFKRSDNLGFPFYSLILISYSAIFGILMTADLFNLYVFLEIYSIASTALFALGGKKEQFSAAFYYLIINTIAATLILLAIGFLLAVSGNLNMENVQIALSGIENSKIITAAVVLFTIGALCKSAVFPVHFWAFSVYQNAHPRVFLLLGSISSNIGFYILARFGYFVVSYQKFFIQYNIQGVLQALGIISILYGSFIAFVEKDFRKILIFSGLVSAGYNAILFSIPEADAFQYACIYNLTDAILKIVMIVIVTEKESLGGMGNIRKVSKLLLISGLINILSAAGLPITIGFFNKIHFLRITLYSTNILIFLLSLVASILSVIYYYNITQSLLFDDYMEHQDNKLYVRRSVHIFICIFILISYVILATNNSLLVFYSKITEILFANSGV